MRQLILDLRPPPYRSLENFVLGANAEVVQTLRLWRDDPRTEPFLYLWGSSGSGKSHLLQALAPPCYLACQPDTRFTPDEHTHLILDDVERLDNEGAWSLFHLINERRAAQGRLLCSGPCPPSQLTLVPELRSRLAWGLVLQVHPLSDPDKLHALQLQARSLGATLPEAAARYILERWSRDLGSLFDLLETLDRWSVSRHQPVITIPLIRQALATQPDSVGATLAGASS